MDDDPRMMPEHDEDWSLLRRSRAGDPGAWERLWRRHGERLYRVALALVRERETARDVAHTVFLRLVERPAPPREESLAAYLTTAAWREALRQLEQDRRRESLENRPEPVGPAEAEDESRERRTHALEALEQLPAPLRETLALRLVGGLSYEETAHVLGIPVGTVRSRLHSGIRSCRDWLRRKGRL